MLKQCQEACELDRRCVAIDWVMTNGQSTCVIITGHNHEHYVNRDSTHYELVSRCDTSTGNYCVVFCSLLIVK